MSNWILPDVTSLTEVVTASKGHLLLCSPYVSTFGLTVVANCLPGKVESVEFWTKLSARDWLTGASDPEGLLDFIEQIEGRVGPVAIRHADNLHAKIVLSDGPKAIAGSANLTAGGYMRNMEASRVVTGREVDQLRALVESMRPNLNRITYERFAEFAKECTAKTDSKEALLDLIRQEAPELIHAPVSTMTYGRFLTFLASNRSALAKETLHIARNLDGNNNTGKVKQAFFGVQRFLQEYPEHRAMVERLPLQWFDVAQSRLLPNWLSYLDRFANEVNPDYGYSIPTLRGYLPVAYGGTLMGGGGGSNELKRVWPLAGRALRRHNR